MVGSFWKVKCCSARSSVSAVNFWDHLETKSGLCCQHQRKQIFCRQPVSGSQRKPNLLQILNAHSIGREPFFAASPRIWFHHLRCQKAYQSSCDVTSPWQRRHRSVGLVRVETALRTFFPSWQTQGRARILLHLGKGAVLYQLGCAKHAEAHYWSTWRAPFRSCK